MTIGEIEILSDVTVRAHINGKLFTTEASLVKVAGGNAVLRLLNVNQFELYAGKTTEYSLCSKAGKELNYISDKVAVKHSASNPAFIAVPADTELIAQKAQRSHARYPYEYELLVNYGDTSHTVDSVDISASGIGVISSRALKIDTRLLIDVYNPILKKSRAFHVVVANCTQKAVNKYFVGLMFERSEDWVLDFVNEFQHTVLQDLK